MSAKNRPRWSAAGRPGPSEPPRRRHSWIVRHRLFTALIAIVGLVVVVSVAGVGGGGSSTAPQEGVATAPAEEVRQVQAEPTKKEPGIGDAVRDGKFEFTVTKVRPGVERVGGQYGEEAQGQFVLVHMTVENIGDESQFFDGDAQKLFDKSDREFSADTLAAAYLEESKSLYNEINPGNKVEGIVVFDIPKDVEPVRIELHDSVFSDGVTVDLERR